MKEEEEDVERREKAKVNGGRTETAPFRRGWFGNYDWFSVDDHFRPWRASNG